MGLFDFGFRKRNKLYYMITALMQTWRPQAISSINTFGAKFPPRRDCYGMEIALEWFEAGMLICIWWANRLIPYIDDAISDYLARCKRSFVDKYLKLEDLSADIPKDENKIIEVKVRIGRTAKFCVGWMTLRSMLIEMSEENLSANFDEGADMLFSLIEPYLIKFENILIEEKLKPRN